jgi:hypothetical protein
LIDAKDNGVKPPWISKYALKTNSGDLIKYMSRSIRFLAADSIIAGRVGRMLLQKQSGCSDCKSERKNGRERDWHCCNLVLIKDPWYS